MNSLILQLAYKYIRWIMILLAVITLFRGHNHPGGGFIGGMLAALAIVMRIYAYDVWTAYQKLFVKPHVHLSLGLSLIVVSTLPSIIQEVEFMKGIWWSMEFGSFYTLKLGTPLIFDIGVFFAVIGVVLHFVYSLNPKEAWK